MPAHPRTTVSTKGQVVLPKALRDRHGWGPGTRLVVEDTPQGVVLRPERLFPETRIEDIYGMLKWDGPPVSIEDMDAAVLEAVAADYLRSIASD